jgi:uncharacterized membrane-anchored protein YhcB (DUF1043 family)
MLGSEFKLNITVSEQTLTSLSFADHTPTAINNWVKDLPMANIGETSRQLYQAIIELNKLIIVPNIRSQLLEIMRQPIHYVCQELSKHFLNQSVVLSDKQQKIANLAQALQIHLANGYKAVMADTTANISNERTRKLFACAAHRMITEYGRAILRSNQLYIPPPKELWLDMHRVFKFSEATNLLKYIITDDENKHQVETRIDQTYKQNLLLSCCRPNQLRQSDIQLVYEAFEIWSDYVEAGAEYSANSVFIINMEQDLPPRYRCLLNSSLTEHYYGFDTAELVDRLTEHLSSLQQKQGDGSSHLTSPKGISDVLINHLNQAFGILTKRTFKRIANQGSLNLCIGLSASHFYISGEVEFHTQMFNRNASNIESDDNIFLTQTRNKNDAWSGTYGTVANTASQSSPLGSDISFDRPVHKDNESYPRYVIPLINTSPGGYCLQWSGDVPKNIQAGEVISLRETEDQPWSIAVIRWIRHIKKKGTQVGIELLAPNAQPCGVQLLHRTGDPSEYLRGMLLPELSSIGQPATLITPRLPFLSGHKVSIRLNETESKCQLEQRVSATASFSQFELSKSVQITGKSTQNNKITAQDTENDFDSLWPTL